MSELKRNQSLYSQPPRAARAPQRSRCAPAPLSLASEPSELRLLESWEDTAAEGGDPYNGTGSRAILRRPPLVQTAPPPRK